MPEKTTPLIEEHRNLGAKLAPFGGWLMPIQYEGIIAEHHWTRRSAALFDICHMGEFLIHGDAAATGFGRIVTIDLATLPIGACRYGFILNGSGGIIDDIIVYRLLADEWMVVVNAAPAPGDAEHFRGHLKQGTDFKDISAETAKLDLQGPRAAEALRKIAGPGVASLGYYRFGRFDLLGEKAIISRTGYTGERGYELYISSAKVAELWQLLLKDPLVRPAGLGARDTLRLEMGYPLYGQDLSTETTPAEAGASRFVAMEKEFIGADALRKGGRPYKRLIYFTAQSRRAPRHHYRIRAAGKEIGTVTSGSFAPSLSVGIGMGYVTTPCAAGTEITLTENGVEIPAVVTGKPFYKKGTATLPEGSYAHTG